MLEGINASQPQNQSLEEMVRSAGVLERAQNARTTEEKQQVKQEFLALFYKEILKQAIKPPSFTGSDNTTTISSTFAGDLLLQKMALELAQSKGLGAEVIDE